MGRNGKARQAVLGLAGLNDFSSSGAEAVLGSGTWSWGDQGRGIVAWSVKKTSIRMQKIK